MSEDKLGHTVSPTQAAYFLSKKSKQETLVGNLREIAYFG